jgi:hypothetical protein
MEIFSVKIEKDDFIRSVIFLFFIEQNFRRIISKIEALYHRRLISYLVRNRSICLSVFISTCIRLFIATSSKSLAKYQDLLFDKT